MIRKDKKYMKILKKFQYNSPVILTFAIVSLFVFLLGEITRGMTTSLFFSTYRSSLLNPLSYIRIFGHVLGHASLEHYTGNILLILLLGPMLEEKYGSKNILMMIAITAVITGLIHNLLFPFGLLGASGIVFMLIILASMASAEEGKIPLTLVAAVIIYLGDEIVAGILREDNISQLTHIIGGICGGVFGMLQIKRR